MGARRAVLAWEIGGGRGHVTTLAVVAQALADIGIAPVAAALIHLDYAHEIAPYVGHVRAGPYLNLYEYLRFELGMPGAATYADWLGDHGLVSVRVVREQVERWRMIYAEEKPDIVIGDQAPLALFTARRLGIATAAIGVPYTLPPPELPRYPAFHELGAQPLWPEEQLVAAINEATESFGGPPLERLPAVYESDAEMCCSPELLDIYAYARRSPRLPALMPPLELVDGPRDEVFVYYSANDRIDPVMLTAALSLPVPTRLFMPGIDQSMKDLFRAKGVIVEDAPVPPTEIVRRSRVAVHAGNLGVTALCLRAGLPFVAAPRAHEQDFNARQCEAAGVCIGVHAGERTVARVRDAVLELYESTAVRSRAQALATRLKPQFTPEPREAVARRIGALFH